MCYVNNYIHLKQIFSIDVPYNKNSYYFVRFLYNFCSLMVFSSKKYILYEKKTENKAKQSMLFICIITDFTKPGA